MVEQGPGDKPLIVVSYKKEIKKYYPEEILGLLLTELKTYAEDYLKTSINELVVTIPVYFNKLQIAATVAACQKAGFSVLRTIKEPQAIALGIYSQSQNQPERKVLIYKIGGNSLDISIIDIYDQLFEVKAMSGDTHLGGEDFIHRLIEYCKEEFREKCNEDIEKNFLAL